MPFLLYDEVETGAAGNADITLERPSAGANRIVVKKITMTDQAYSNRFCKFMCYFYLASDVGRTIGVSRGIATNLLVATVVFDGDAEWYRDHKLFMRVVVQNATKVRMSIEYKIVEPAVPKKGRWW